MPFSLQVSYKKVIKSKINNLQSYYCTRTDTFESTVSSQQVPYSATPDAREIMSRFLANVTIATGCKR